MMSIQGRWQLVESDNRPINYEEEKRTKVESTSDITREQASEFAVETTVETEFFGVGVSATTSYGTS